MLAEDLVQAALEQKPLEFAKAFDDAMKERVAELVDASKEVLAQSYITPPEEPEEEEDEDDLIDSDGGEDDPEVREPNEEETDLEEAKKAKKDSDDKKSKPKSKSWDERSKKAYRDNVEATAEAADEETNLTEISNPRLKSYIKTATKDSVKKRAESNKLSADSRGEGTAEYSKDKKDIKLTITKKSDPEKAAQAVKTGAKSADRAYFVSVAKDKLRKQSSVNRKV